MGGSGGGSGEVGASEAVSLVFRIATVGLSLASAIMTAASTQCVYRDDGVPAGTVSYGDYASFKYSALADLLSAVLQGVAIYLEATRKDRAARAVELIDKLVQALTSSSAALLLAVDDITSCGGGGGPGGQRQRGGGLCSQAGAFCGRVRVSSVLSVAATVSISGSVYIRHARAAVVMPPRPPPPTTTILNVVKRKDGGRKEKEETVEKRKVVLIKTEKTEDQVKTKRDDNEEEKEEDEVNKDEECCRSYTEVSTPPAMPPPWCRCPRLTIPCDCEDPELCGAFF
ncbi:hypothetical protein SETIT_3G345100v2 [Setaria italica]|uniref:CASP-like protein n=1 Tax=Setaria italica TaxID=4555 RepID=K3Z8L2_SETIT|nr:CASP-like protein 1U1 [Setaria italica]RCV18959.1 hypothetical protein SETIT_3G345100v2 [Setaria italica]